MCPGVDSASKNEYQNAPGGKDGRCVRLPTYHLHNADGSLNLPDPQGPVQACSGKTLPWSSASGRKRRGGRGGAKYSFSVRYYTAIPTYNWLCRNSWRSTEQRHKFPRPHTCITHIEVSSCDNCPPRSMELRPFESLSCVSVRTLSNSVVQTHSQAHPPSWRPFTHMARIHATFRVAFTLRKLRLRA